MKFKRISVPGGRVSLDVAFDARTTVLDAMERLRVEGEPGLLYRHSCHHGSCGTCGALVNGKPVLMCLTRLSELPGDTVTVEPLRAFEGLGGAAVRPDELFKAMPDATAYVREAERSKTLPLPPDVARRERLENCLECGICVEACPVTEPFSGPQALAAARREIDNRGGRTEEMLAFASRPEGVAACERHVECSRSCPAGVMPARKIQELKALIVKKD